jgi:hypothetical protein
MSRHTNFLRRNFTLQQARSMWAQVDAATALASRTGDKAPFSMLDRRHSDGQLVPRYSALVRSAVLARATEQA